MSGYFAIPRDIYNSIKAERNGEGIGIEVALLAELAFRARYNGNYLDNLSLGQCKMGLEEMARVIGTSYSRVRSALAILRKLAVISQKSDRNGTLISLLRSDIYTKLDAPASQNVDRIFAGKSQLTNNNNNNNYIAPPSKKKKIREKKEYELREVSKEEVNEFSRHLRDSLETIKNPVNFGVLTIYLRTFATKDEAVEDLERLFNAAQRAKPDDVDGQVGFLNGCINKHLSQMKEAYGN